MNRFDPLLTTADLAVRRVDHPPHEPHHDPEVEVADRWVIAFVRAGRFDVHVDRTRHQLRAGSVLITHPGAVFRCSHGSACPDDVCLAVSFAPEVVANAAAAWEDAGWLARETASPRLGHAQARLALAANAGDPFELERWALDALAALESDVARARRRGPYATRSSDRDAVIATCRAIEADPVERRSVAARARDVGLTGPRLTHAFRRYLGQSPHQFVVRWRLVVATTRLGSGASVSESCYDAGFENLSHFCRSFRREFGVAPSAWRTMAEAERRWKVQACLAQASVRSRLHQRTRP